MPGPTGKVPEALHNLYSNPNFKISSESWQQAGSSSSSDVKKSSESGKPGNYFKERKAAEEERWAALQERQRKRATMTMGKAVSLMGFVTWSGMLKKLYQGGGIKN